LDIQMPVMNGFEVLQQIRKLEYEQDKPRTPVIALTAYTRWIFRESFLSSGFDGFIAKPLDKNELKSIIAGCCG